MQYRNFGKDGWKVSALGFGAMRLPGLTDGTVDIEQSVKLIRYGIDKGINYIDTAYVYHNGLSEGIVAMALKDGYRQKVRIATKSPGHLITTGDDFDRILDEQLRRLDDTKIDYYMFHGIGATGLSQIEKLKLIEKIESAKKQGKIGHIGFSFHEILLHLRKLLTVTMVGNSVRFSIITWMLVIRRVGKGSIMLHQKEYRLL
jgi:predicted aldo/keto reductase-like oxidoreductase